MATSVGDITAHLRLDTRDWGRELNRATRSKRRWMMLIACCYAATTIELLVLLLIRP